MASYVYQCGRCGAWEVSLPMGTAPTTSSCPSCGSPSPRRFTAPMIARTPAAVTRARLGEEASRDQPQVTTSVPDKPARPAPHDPRWSKLPRP